MRGPCVRPPLLTHPCHPPPPSHPVSQGKKGYRGCDAHHRLKGAERFKIFGLLFDSPDAAPPPNGSPVVDAATGATVGTLTQAMHSAVTGRTMAIARLPVALAVPGMALAVGGAAVTTHSLPFDDPSKSKRMAKG